MESFAGKQVVPNLSTVVREPEAPQNLQIAVNSLPLHQRIGVLVELGKGSSIAEAVRNTMGGLLHNK